MSALATDFPGRKRSDVSPINVVPAQPHDERNEHNDMAPRRQDSDEDFAMREVMHGMMLAQTSLCKTLEAQAMARPAIEPNGEKRRMNWFMASIAAITILGAGGNFIGSSGMWIGNRNRDAEDIRTVKDEVASLRTWNEKLRNNMSAYGWLIDNEGNVNRIEETVKPKRR